MKNLAAARAGRPRHRRGSWTMAGSVVRALTRRWETSPDRLALLAAAWDRETGARAAHWPLAGVRGAIIYVRPRSSAAAQELAMRAPGLLRSLNKYFSRAWIKGIKTALR